MMTSDILNRIEGLNTDYTKADNVGAELELKCSSPALQTSSKSILWAEKILPLLPVPSVIHVGYTTDESIQIACKHIINPRSSRYANLFAFHQFYF
jgi:hypothetical protein